MIGTERGRTQADLATWEAVQETLGCLHVRPGDPAVPPPRGVSTDTRTLRPGTLFFALEGPRFDGHDFLAAAAARGAAGLVVRPGRGGETHRPWVLEVADPLAALGRYGAACRRLWGGVLVAVTGSCGKTTTKALVAAALGPAAAASPGTENNAIGVPRFLAGLRRESAAAVVELGTSRPGEIAHLAALSRPDVAVLTGIGPAHLEGLGDEGGVFREKWTLVEALPAAGAAVLNGDDPRLGAAPVPRGVTRVTFGLRRGNTFRGEVLSAGPEGLVVRVEGRRLRLPLLGVHNARNVLGAYAVARLLGVGGGELAERLRAVAPPAQRLVVRRSRWGQLLDDTYNANPASVRAALETLARWPAAGRRVAILGDMLELGERAAVLHREIGKAASDCGIDVLWAVGSLAVSYLDGAATPVRGYSPDGAAAARFLPGILRRGDVVLVKGSRALRLERLVGALLAPEEGGK